MADITKTVTPKKTTVELVAETNRDGVTMEYISIDGVKIGTMGYTSQKDKDAALRLIQRVVDNSENTDYALYREIMETCMTGAAMTEEGIQAAESEEVEIEGVPIIINYEVQKAYIGVNQELKAIADLESHKMLFRQTETAKFANLKTVMAGMEMTNMVTNRLLEG